MSASSVFAGLTPESRAAIDTFFRWSKLSLDKFKRDLSVEASAFQSGNLLGEHYSQAEVRHMLGGQLAMLQGVVDSQLDGIAAAAAALLRAVLREADRQRVSLTGIDVMNTLTDVGGVGAMGEHGRQLLSGPTNRLAPLTVAEAGGEAARQLAEANEEVLRLREKLRYMTDQYTRVMRERSDTNATVLALQGELAAREQALKQAAVQPQAQQQQPVPRQSPPQVGQSPQPNDEHHALQAQRAQEAVEAMQQQMQQLRHELQEAKRELATRLSQSTQFVQIKQLLTRRNAQIKELQARLARCDPTYRIDEGDLDIEPEDD